MSERIKYSLNIQVIGGASIPITGEITPEAYGKIRITVPAGTTNLEVNLQPEGANLAEFLLIKSSSYGDALTYQVNDANPPNLVIKLDSPHVFMGKGAVGILNPEPTKLLFTNGLTSDVTIDILIGRDATPSP